LETPVLDNKQHRKDKECPPRNEHSLSVLNFYIHYHSHIAKKIKDT